MGCEPGKRKVKDATRRRFYGETGLESVGSSDLEEVPVNQKWHQERALTTQYVRVQVGAGKRVSLQHSQLAMAMVPSSSTLPSGTGAVWKSNDTRNAQLQHAAKPVPTVDLPALQGAGRVIHEQLLKDAQAVPALGDMLTIRAPHVSSCFALQLIPLSWRAILCVVQRLPR